MTNILHISASIRSDDSISRRLGNAVVERLSQTGGANVTTRDLAAEDVPYVSEARFAANLTPAGERTPEQAELAAISDTLIAELQTADTIVIATPIYNFGAPASLKAWADLVARAGTTFKYTETGPVGLLEGKQAVLAIASGGTPIGAEFDYMSSWLTFFLGFLGIGDVQIVSAAGTMGPDGEDAIAKAHADIAQLAF